MAKSKIQSIPFQQPFVYKDHELELLPAGHITGSAMLHVRKLTDDSTLLYTGDFKTRHSHTALAIEYRQADHLIMESTFGKPHYLMPPQAEVVDQLVSFVDQALAEHLAPVILAYSLGKAQEAHYLLGENGISPILHPAVAKMSAECIRMGIRLPDYYYLDELCPERQCIIMPPGALKSTYLSSVGNFRTAMLTGWSLDTPRPWRYKDVHTLIPMSDHADYQGLLECVEQVNPKKITTVHGSTKEFAADLRRRGYEAWSAGGNDQLELI